MTTWMLFLSHGGVLTVDAIESPSAAIEYGYPYHVHEGGKPLAVNPAFIVTYFETDAPVEGEE